MFSSTATAFLTNISPLFPFSSFLLKHLFYYVYVPFLLFSSFPIPFWSKLLSYLPFHVVHLSNTHFIHLQYSFSNRLNLLSSFCLLLLNSFATTQLAPFLRLKKCVVLHVRFCPLFLRFIPKLQTHWWLPKTAVTIWLHFHFNVTHHRLDFFFSLTALRFFLFHTLICLPFLFLASRTPFNLPVADDTECYPHQSVAA